jgi:predicted AlkP superfamily phosphohydrolase/phosphomutase
MLLVAVLAVASSVSAPTSSACHRPRLVLVTVDGGAQWLLERWLATRHAPAFAKLAADGVMAEGVVPSVPTLTAASHATIFTGASPRVHGIAANQLLIAPASTHTILQTQTGFDSRLLRAEPIWLSVVRAGLRAVVLHGPTAYPFTRSDRLLQFDVYNGDLMPPAVVTGTLEAGRASFDTPAGPGVVAAAGSRLRVSIGDRSFELEPQSDRAWTSSIRARVKDEDGAFRIGLLEWTPGGNAFRLYRGRVGQIVSSRRGAAARLEARAGALVDDGAVVRMYQKGLLGLTLGDGGHGGAEENMVTVLRATSAYFHEAFELAADQPWQLLVTYIPILDTAGHALAGMIDPASSKASPDLADRVWPFFDRIFEREIDGYIAHIRKRCPDAAILVTADHGLEGSGREVFPNVILRQAGLLAVNGDGRIDLSRTKAWVGPSRAGLVTINSTRFQQGIVRPDEEPSIRRAIVAALLSARDPETGAAVIRAVFDGALDGAALGIDPGDGADLVFDPAPDYDISSSTRAGGVAAPIAEATGDGGHGSLPTRRTLHGFFVAAGPGIPRGTRLPLIRSIDVAPTISRLLGIPPPAQATGLPLIALDNHASADSKRLRTR